MRGGWRKEEEEEEEEKKRKKRKREGREGPTALTGSCGGDWPEGRSGWAPIGGKDVHRIFQGPIRAGSFTLGRISITRFGHPDIIAMTVQ